MPQALADAVAAVLRPQFPFDDALREVPSINARTALSGTHAFSAELKPVFFVGDLKGAPRYLLLGLKPGLGAASNPRFQSERRSLNTSSFDEYFESRLNYFQQDAFNGTHYRPIAKLLNTLAGEPFPSDPAAALNRNAVQVEMFPLFAASQGFGLKELRWLRTNTVAGRTAAEVLDASMDSHTWDLAIARYFTTFQLICELFDGQAGEPVGIFPTASIVVRGRRLRLVCLPGTRGISDAHLSLRDSTVPPARHLGPGGRSTAFAHGTFSALRERILAIDVNIGERPRAAGSLAFDFPYGAGRRNFACITPRSGGVKLDALGLGRRFENGIPVVSLEAAVTRCVEALGYLR